MLDDFAFTYIDLIIKGMLIGIFQEIGLINTDVDTTFNQLNQPCSRKIISTCMCHSIFPILWDIQKHTHIEMLLYFIHVSLGDH